MLPDPLTLLARLLERDGGREEPRGEFSSSVTVYRTPANGENMVLTHMSKRVYAALAYRLTVAEWIFAIVSLSNIVQFSDYDKRAAAAEFIPNGSD